MQKGGGGLTAEPEKCHKEEMPGLKGQLQAHRPPWGIHLCVLMGERGSDCLNCQWCPQIHVEQRIINKYKDAVITE